MLLSSVPSLSDRLTAEGEANALHALGEVSLPPRLRADAATSVLDITEWFGETSGGIRTYLLEKARYVDARPWLRQTIVVPGHRDRVVDGDGVRLYRLRGPHIPGQRPYRFMLATRSVSRVLRHERPDLIEVGSPFIIPWITKATAQSLDIPMVCFAHTDVPRQFAPNAERDGTLRRALARASAWYLRRLDRLFPLTIVASDYAATELARIGIDRVAKVPLGVDLERFSPERRERARDTRRRFQLPEGPLAAFVGRFAREKELGVVLDAWRDVERRCGARLVLVGAGPMESMLKAHPYGHRVTFIPFLRDRDALADLLAAFDLYVAAGPLETFGLSAIEAMASGTPVLTVRHGAVLEHVRTGGGSSYERGSAGSLADEAVQLFACDLSALGEQARRHAERAHAWDTVFDRLFAVYRGVLER
ncbi:glycosyltransferase [Gemmatimonas groenlandica]|uniref:Glycosyltransferase n=1 Tax=Gemmatimonas groenlandica TaxID=2732249 RepID=A0A6M4INJ4_9BACT|nr:glycosyltransferase [Gemmatimonas groenlandica]QJR34562.1 glycosyltransferase [Gemmatimonas groenlandica]